MPLAILENNFFEKTSEKSILSDDSNSKISESKENIDQSIINFLQEYLDKIDLKNETGNKIHIGIIITYILLYIIRCLSGPHITSFTTEYHPVY